MSHDNLPKSAQPQPAPSCANCLKQTELCFCSQIEALSTRLHVLILQHPQEPDKLLGTAKIAQLALKNATLKVGLSWPNLSKALGRPVEQGKWGVLYLGGKDKTKDPDERLQILAKGGKVFSLGEIPIEGIVILDGSWAQAKTMWWRNPWLLKLKRLVLNPPTRSMYGDLRREPRRECLSTIEALAETLDVFGENQSVPTALRNHFQELLGRYRKLDAKS